MASETLFFHVYLEVPNPIWPCAIASQIHVRIYAPYVHIHTCTILSCSPYFHAAASLLCFAPLSLAHSETHPPNNLNLEVGVKGLGNRLQCNSLRTHNTECLTRLFTCRPMREYFKHCRPTSEKYSSLWLPPIPVKTAYCAGAHGCT